MSLSSLHVIVPLPLTSFGALLSNHPLPRLPVHGVHNPLDTDKLNVQHAFCHGLPGFFCSERWNFCSLGCFSCTDSCMSLLIVASCFVVNF
ncbi:hypothetical protein CEXT_802661 [Caerostris extrusa]|uniref:Secreted protein n=1 Tax=Caerostris extrusa TaxID=172846 RepID=A0AAV4NS97_CAEEX|nr:hypothetical protein CEXT_802661 [Caerostris extrusa]